MEGSSASAKLSSHARITLLVVRSAMLDAALACLELNRDNSPKTISLRHIHFRIVPKGDDRSVAQVVNALPWRDSDTRTASHRDARQPRMFEPMMIECLPVAAHLSNHNSVLDYQPHVR